MRRSDQHVSIVNALFGLAIAFWCGDMAAFIAQGMFRPTPGFGLEDVRQLQKTDADHAQRLKAAIEEARTWGQLADILREQKTKLDKWTPPVPAETKQVFANLTTLAESYVFWGPLAWILTAIAGCLFLVDIACVAWWYARYLYKVQAFPSLYTYFVDFGVCAAFNVAARRWTDPWVFLTATCAAAALLVVRFVHLYRSPDASASDKYILRDATRLLKIVALVSLLVLLSGLVIYGTRQRIEDRVWRNFVHPTVASLISAVGIWVTYKYRARIRRSAEQHEVDARRFRPMPLNWPRALQNSRTQRDLIGEATRKGLQEFYVLFGEQHTRSTSRVHAEGDVRVQSYILAVASYLDGAVDTEEVARKASVVGVSHWLDDLLDGREELHVRRVLSDAQILKSATRCPSGEDAFVAFGKIYRAIITKSATNDQFYDRLVDIIKRAAVVQGNVEYIFAGLNRVAIGCVIFSPLIGAPVRQLFLKEHNDGLIARVEACAKLVDASWVRKVIELLTSMRERHDGLGDILLGLTTKTVQELAMSSERNPLNFPLSVLFDVLYAPLLYFHDLDHELDAREMSPLDVFDVNYDAIVPWLAAARQLIDEAPDDPEPRAKARVLQRKMAFGCFASTLPQVSQQDIRGIMFGTNGTGT